MKKYVLLALTIFQMISSPAQQDDQNGPATRDPRAREKIMAAHAAYITERLELTASEAEKFWPVYRQYHEDRRALRADLREARRKDMDDKSLLELDLTIKQQELDLEKKYSEQLEKIISAEQILRLRQAEADFRRLMLRQIQHRQRRRN